MEVLQTLVGFVSRLSIERRVYLFILTAFALASCVTLLYDSADLPTRSLGPGWHLLSSKHDIADFEWTFWFSDLRESIVLGLIGHVFVSYAATFCLPWTKEPLVAFYCAYCARLALGETFVAINVIVCLIFYFLSAASKSKTLCWVFTVISVLLLHFDGFYMEIMPSALDVDDAFLPIAYSALTFTVLRCCSFFFERTKGDAGGDHGLMQLLKYNFYLPYFFFGPIMTYDVFVKKTDVTPTKANIVGLMMEGFKVVAGVAIVDFLLHFIHVSSIASDTEYLEGASVHVLGFLLFANVLLDWVKALVLYEITSRIATVVDGHSGVPEAPKCIATICTFADTYFDRGIQHWVSRYIYDPVGDGHKDLSKETYSSVITFLFVAIWQGPSPQVIIWAILNCIGLTFEFFISEMTPTQDKENKRVVAFFLGMNYWCILLFNAVGINGIEKARIIAKCIFFSGNLSNIFIALVLSYSYAAFLTVPAASKKKQA